MPAEWQEQSRTTRVLLVVGAVASLLVIGLVLFGLASFIVGLVL